MKKDRFDCTTTVSPEEFQKIAKRVSVISIISNVVLSICKLLAGILAHSGAMISDAVHSAADVFSTVIVMIGVIFASKAPDKEHPYGHERMECVAAIVLSMVLFITGLGIGADSVQTIWNGNYSELQVPGFLAIVIAILSILVKEGMYWYTRHHAKRISSGALLADAWHHRSDALSSIGAFVGICGAMLGYPMMDSVASLCIFFFIVKAAYDIFTDAINKMIDRSCDEETEQDIAKCVLQNEEVLELDRLQTRMFGNKLYVDVEILLNGTYTLQKAHEIAEQVHDKIETSFPNIKHIMVHVNSKDT